MSNAHKKAGLPRRITLDAQSVTPARSSSVTAASRDVLVIINEAGGIPKSIFVAVDALATNIDARVVAVQVGMWKRSAP